MSGRTRLTRLSLKPCIVSAKAPRDIRYVGSTKQYLPSETGKRSSILALTLPVRKQFLGKRRLGGQASLGVVDGIIGMGYDVNQSPILEHLNLIPGFNGVFLPDRRGDHDLAFVEHLYRFHSTPQNGIKLDCLSILYNLFRFYASVKWHSKRRDDPQSRGVLSPLPPVLGLFIFPSVSD